MGSNLTQLDKLENQSIFIIREAYSQFNKVAMLWSISASTRMNSIDCHIRKQTILYMEVYQYA
jgi:hypothetical protein